MGKKFEELINEIMKNHDLSQDRYPDLIERVLMKTQDSESFTALLIIEELNNCFPEWKQKSEDHSRVERIKKFKDYIECISLALEELNDYYEKNDNYEYLSEKLFDQLEYWKGELNELSSHKINQPELEKTLIKIKLSENKFWKGIPMDKVIEHFEIMTKRKNKNGVSFLMLDQYIIFLKKGFLNEVNLPVQKVNCINGEKGLVISRFYEFYVLASSTYKHPSKKEKFIKLFTDCFDNWEPKTIEAFFKPDKAKDKW